jgi:diguanylate cyclase (GGDEF)-like protein
MLKKLKNIILKIIKPPDHSKKLIMDQSVLEFEDEARYLLQYRGFKLKFSARLEKLFENFNIQQRRRRYFIIGLIVLLFFDLFCIIDYLAIPEIYKTAWFIRLCIVTPIMIISMFINNSERFRNIMDYVAFGDIIIIFSSFIIIYGIINPVFMPISSFSGILITVVCGNIIARIPFWHAFVISSIIQLIYPSLSIVVIPIPAIEILINSIVLFTVIVITLIGNYQFEKELRRDTLLTLLFYVESIKLEESNRKLKELSILDSLTGLANRRLFDETIDMEWRVCIRRKTSISIIFIDIDYFKLFNDNYGHQAGDECLKRIAGKLKKHARRPHDLCARYGGEEFVIILPEIGISEAAELAEKIRIDIHKLQIKHDFSDIASHVTVSIGIAGTVPTLLLRYDNLIQQADDALYAAKSGGRDRVAISEQDIITIGISSMSSGSLV